MSDTTSSLQAQRKLVSWRAALLRQGESKPIYGHATEVALQSAVFVIDEPLRDGTQLKAFLELPDADARSRVYAEFTIKVLACTLMGGSSRYRLQCRVSEIDEAQRKVLERALSRTS
ncbi:hypothetical protein GCM10007860_28860 [Chitiniphilus shinanonensis]|uniref:PilZ domain-containing protein n=1 Tax=Chitiniphilus shinanonensis TaxID=553088 RepID=A0ABQ6BVP6_9NEIS|nr:hypothetical protein [Chitiniphilus shinanonensis]GLS05729.1 hypothetical protein GCM10007860_28860 [Chitiniphilus shinanonensis]